MKTDIFTNAASSSRQLVWMARLRKCLCVLLLMTGVALGPVACSTSKPKSAETAHSPHATGAALELNDGKRWAVPAPMMAHIRNIEKEVQNFEARPGGDHTVLAASIQENIGRFVTSCTLEGKAHDELHKWLMPLLGLSADYAKAAEPRVRQEKLDGIRNSLIAFNEYFE